MDSHSKIPSDEDEMSLDDAVANVAEALKNFDEQTPENQALLRGLLVTLAEQQEQAKRRERELKLAESKRRSEQYADRKQRIKDHVPQWCEENLKPGMIIKVKAANAGFRRVIEVSPGYVLQSGYQVVGEVKTQHVGYNRKRDPETRELSWSLTDGNYITNHTLTNVTGVVLRTKSTGEPIITSVLELAEGAKNP